MAASEQGGRIILYVEPLIVYWFSQLAQGKASKWRGLEANGQDYDSGYRKLEYFTMAGCLDDWEDWVVKVSKRLVGDFDADGIFLDSWA